ncbi:MAG: Mur ligase family protein [Erysipelotrichaceae bacterium]|nr:Mur ligase family protein [Erysipelotrichaceae bacterium]
MPFKNIDEALSYIMSAKASYFTYEQFKELCHSFNDPQNDFYTVHVAGTNGKGSTVAYLRDLLIAYGYKVGTYTSPHYICHQDRIRINNINIPDDIFLRLANKYYDVMMDKKLSMFQIDYLIMCDYFKEEHVDMAIVEVGLGGRLDATNVVDNTELSIITTIGYDHMEKLGDTLEKICIEKCGIIKQNSKTLIGKLNDNCKKIALDICKERNNIFHEIKDYKDLGNRSFIYDGQEYSLESYARYQLHNASLALEALNIISKDLDFKVDYEKNYKALKSSVWQCRFEIVHDNPRIILDGGHNIHGIEALCESFDQFEGSKCIIFSALKRKEYKKMVDKLKKHCDELIITTFENNEVIDLDSFTDEKCYEDYKEAIDYAVRRYDNILICGSLYFMSEIVANCHFDL